MDLLESILQQVASYAGDFSPRLVVLLFLLLAIGEFGIFSIPYLLETVWLLSGYNFSTGRISFLELAILWLSAQAGRQAGIITLYYLSRLGSLPLKKLRARYSQSESSGLTESSLVPFKFLRKLNLLSPFSVALGRLFWLRVPLTLTLAFLKRLRVLSLGVLISSIIWDGVYITAGETVGAHAPIQPTQMILFSLVGMTVLYATIFVIRRLLMRRAAAREQPDR